MLKSEVEIFSGGGLENPSIKYRALSHAEELEHKSPVGTNAVKFQCTQLFGRLQKCIAWQHKWKTKVSSTPS